MLDEPSRRWYNLAMYTLHLDTNGSSRSFPVRTEEDLDRLLDMFPGATRMVADSTGIRQTLGELASYLSTGHTDAWVEESGSLAKSAVVPLIAAAFITFSSYGTVHVDRFLTAISKVESDGGHHLDHPVIKKGMHAGDRAIGRWALMRRTVDDVLSRVRKSSGFLPPILSPLEGADRDSTEAYFASFPEAEEYLAKTLARVVLRGVTSPDEAAYRWLHGHNIAPEDLDPDEVLSDAYVQRFEAAYGDGARGIMKADGLETFRTKISRMKQQEPEGVQPFALPDRSSDAAHVARSDSGEKFPGTRGEVALATMAEEARRKKRKR